MSSFVAYVLFLVILLIVKQSSALVELPQTINNDILKTEHIIRDTTNKLFTSIKSKGVKKDPKLKQYRLIHNYFVSLTLKDYNNLKEISRLTRVDKNTIGNKIINFIDLINEILDAEHYDFNTEANGSSYNLNDEIVNYIDNYSNGLAYLKATYGDDSPRVNINNEIMNIFERDKLYSNYTALKEHSNFESDDLLTDDGYWIPDLRRIYKGKRTKIKDFPFMASVEMFNHFQCAGSIIRNDLVITAASCLQLAWNNRFYRENPAFLSVRVGSDYYEVGGESIPVIEVYFYPSYNPKTLRNNIAVMRLYRKIKFRRRKKRVRQISFDRSELPMTMCAKGVTIVGWGAKTRANIIHSPHENKLSYGRLDIYLLEDCQDIYSKKYVTKKHFCAGFVSRGAGACNKDVGGPGIVAGVLKGIVSFGSPTCGTPDAPTVFTKVGYYADWIEHIIDQERRIPVIKRYTTTSSPRTTYTSRTRPRSTTQTSMNLILENEDMTSPPNFSESTYPSFKKYLKTIFNSKEIDEYIKSANNLRTHNDFAQAKDESEVTVPPLEMSDYESATQVNDEDSLPSYRLSSPVTEETFQTLDIEYLKADEIQESLQYTNGLRSSSLDKSKVEEEMKNTVMKNVHHYEKIADVRSNRNNFENNGGADETILNLLHKYGADNDDDNIIHESGNSQHRSDENENKTDYS